MNQTPTAKREVAESSFDLLHHAIVDKISRNHPEKDLEMIGYTVGQKLVERYVKEKPIMENDLAVITFLCKDFWTEVYGKQMDKLRTNHKGVFELQDHRFRALLRVSAGSQVNLSEAAKKYLIVPCGMIRGSLAALGLEATGKDFSDNDSRN